MLYWASFIVIFLGMCLGTGQFCKTDKFIEAAGGLVLLVGVIMAVVGSSIQGLAERETRTETEPTEDKQTAWNKTPVWLGIVLIVIIVAAFVGFVYYVIIPRFAYEFAHGFCDYTMKNYGF